AACWRATCCRSGVSTEPSVSGRVDRWRSRLSVHCGKTLLMCNRCRPRSPHHTQTRLAGTIMPISMKHERDNIYRIDVSGVLTKSDLERSEAWLVAEMARIGPTRLLFVLNEFKG